MDELPGNSQMPGPEKKPVETRVTTVLTGEVSRRKTPVGKKFLRTFFGDTAKGVMAYVVADVVVPAFKDLLVDTVQEAILRAVYGDTVGNRRRSGSHRNAPTTNYTSYNKVSTPTNPARREEPRMSPRGRETHQFDEVLFDNRADADEVLRSLYDILGQYDVVSVKDFLSACRITPSYTDEKWGWYKLDGSIVQRDRGGKYIINLPPTVPLTS